MCYNYHMEIDKKLSEAVILCRRKGMSGTDIAKVLSISPVRVYAIIKQLGLPPLIYKDTLRNKEMKRLRFEEHLTLQEIADKFGITRERVRQIIGNSGIKYGGFRGKRRRKT